MTNPTQASELNRNKPVTSRFETPASVITPQILEEFIALGIDVDLSVAGMGTRARRGVITVKTGVVSSIELEAPGKFDVSSADACMLKLG